MRKAEEALRGQHVSEDIFQRAAQVGASEVSIFPHHGYSTVYLRECLKIQTLKALTLAFERACQD
jgi:hypothetical protein